jgi:hypothetical protein
LITELETGNICSHHHSQYRWSHKNLKVEGGDIQYVEEKTVQLESFVSGISN